MLLFLLVIIIITAAIAGTIGYHIGKNTGIRRTLIDCRNFLITNKPEKK